MKSFGSSDLVKCLVCLGFSKELSAGSSHIKYKCPKAVDKGTRPFITVILKVKSYDKTTQGRYLTQIKMLGYTKEEATAALENAQQAIEKFTGKSAENPIVKEIKDAQS